MGLRVFLACVGVCLLAGCSGGGAPGVVANRDDHYSAYAKDFGELLLKGDYAAAYDRCSSHLKARMTLEAFTKAHQEALKIYGKAARVSGTINFTKPELLQGQKGWPDGCDRQARAFANFHLEAEDDGSRAEYCCGLNIARENGQDLVCAFDYAIN